MQQQDQSQQTQWQGPERRQSSGPCQGPDRRRAGGYTDTGVNAEEPMDEQEERELAQERGPNPGIPK